MAATPSKMTIIHGSDQRHRLSGAAVLAESEALIYLKKFQKFVLSLAL